jgi:hypothetical protein
MLAATSVRLNWQVRKKNHELLNLAGNHCAGFDRLNAKGQQRHGRMEKLPLSSIIEGFSAFCVKMAACVLLFAFGAVFQVLSASDIIYQPIDDHNSLSPEEFRDVYATKGRPCV